MEGMKQMEGASGQVVKTLAGKERIFSRRDTKKIFQLSEKANDKVGLRKLGEAVFNMIKKQDETPPEFV